MADLCMQCGSTLGESEAFCTKCGAQRNQSAPVEKQRCANCGSELKPSLKFCEACGTRVEQKTAAQAGWVPADQHAGQAAASATAPPFQPVPGSTAPGGGSYGGGVPAMGSVPGQPPRKMSALAKILIAGGTLVVLVVAGIIGTGVYVGYRIKKKAENIHQAYKKAIAEASSESGSKGQSGDDPDLGKLFGALSKGSDGKSGDAPDFGKMLQALSDGKSGDSPDIAKMLGTLGRSLHDKNHGNVERRPAGTCAPADESAVGSYVRNAASASIPLVPGLALTDIWTPRANQPDIEVLTTVNTVDGNSIQVTGKALAGNGAGSPRNLCAADLVNGREYEAQFGPSTPTTIRGATMFTLSRAVFSDLKAGRPAALTFYEAFNDAEGGYDLNSLGKGTIARVEASDVPYSIIVNGERRDLPSIHATGNLGDRTFDLSVLDDIANPLVLNLKVHNSPFHITYVKITFPEKKEVEQQLAKTGHADIYGIYFDFDKATPRAESAPVLKEIAQALKDNPKWKLEIAGHTDNVGGNTYNLNLSDQRAQGVMHSLITEYGIDADRLSAKGFGQTQPKATNDTAEGRALNRRVELVRD